MSKSREKFVRPSSSVPSVTSPPMLPQCPPTKPLQQLPPMKHPHTPLLSPPMMLLSLSSMLKLQPMKPPHTPLRSPPMLLLLQLLHTKLLSPHMKLLPQLMWPTTHPTTSDPHICLLLTLIRSRGLFIATFRDLNIYLFLRPTQLNICRNILYRTEI